jgi:hypothetical protein
MARPDRGPAPPVRGSALQTGCIVVAVLLGVGLLVATVAGIWVATHPMFPGMSPLPRPEARVVGDVELDPSREVAELAFRLTVSPAGLPRGIEGVDATAYLELDLETTSQPRGSTETQGNALIEVAISDLDRADSIRSMSPVLPGADVRFTLACSIGESCVRTFLIRIQRSDEAAPDARLEVSWRITAELRHARGVTLSEPQPVAIEMIQAGEDP